MVKGVKINWTDEHKQWIKDNQHDIRRKELFERFKSNFEPPDNANFTNFKGLITRMGLKNGFDGKRKKGETPWNKGKTGYMGANRTSFKKGHKPANYRPIGSERICAKDGYRLIKVAKTGRRWQHKHKVLWEQHNGKIPDGHIIRFIDGDKTNITIDNLMCVPMTANMVINLHNKADTDNPELNKAIMLTEIVKQKIKEAV